MNTIGRNAEISATIGDGAVDAGGNGAPSTAQGLMSIFNGTTWYLQLVTAVWGE